MIMRDHKTSHVVVEQAWIPAGIDERIAGDPLHSLSQFVLLFKSAKITMKICEVHLQHLHPLTASYTLSVTVPIQGHCLVHSHAGHFQQYHPLAVKYFLMVRRIKIFYTMVLAGCDCRVDNFEAS